MALSLSGTGGMQAMVGIQMRIGTQGVVTGATVAKRQLGELKTTAKRTARNIDDTSKSLGNLHQQALQASAGLATAGFALFMFGRKVTSMMGENVVGAAGDYEVAMSRVQFATNATAKEMKNLDSVMVDVGLRTIETPTSAADAFKGLRTAGLRTNEALELLPKTIQMVTGSAGLLGMTEAVRASVSAVKKFEHQGVPFAKTMDDIAQSTRETALQWEDMPAFFNALRDAPMRLKATSAEMLALGGLMKAGGMQAAQSGQSISIFANKFITNARKLEAYKLKKGITEEQFFAMDPKDLPRRMIMFQKFGVSLFNAAGKMRPFEKVMVDVIKRADELSKVNDKEALTTLSAVFGDKAGAMVTMLQQVAAKGLDASTALRKFISSVDDSVGASEKAEQAFLRTAKGIEKLIEGTNKTIGIIMGKTLLPMYSVLLQSLKFVLDNILRITQANPVLAKSLAVVAVVLGVLATVAGAVLIGLGALLFYTEVLGPAMAAVGGFAGALAKGFTAIKAALVPLAMGAAVAAGAIVVLYGVFKLWDHIWTTTTDGIALTIRSFFEDVKFIFMGLAEWWNGKGGPNSLELFETLRERGLDGFVGAVLQFKRRLEIIFGGIWKGMKQILIPVGKVLQGLFAIVGFLIDGFDSFFKLFSTGDDMRDQIEYMEKFGQIIGWVIGAALVPLAVALISSAGYFVAMGIASTVSRLKFIALAGAILLVAVAYGGLVNSANKAGEALGPKLWEIVDKTKRKMALFSLSFMEFGIDTVAWFREGFGNGWDGFVSWFEKQIKYLWTVTKGVFGMASAEEVASARSLAAGKSAFGPKLATDRMAELMVRSGEGVSGAEGDFRKAVRDEGMASVMAANGIKLERPQSYASDAPLAGASSFAGSGSGDREPRTVTIDKPVININTSGIAGDAKEFGRRIAESLEQTINEDWERGFNS